MPNTTENRSNQRPIVTVLSIVLKLLKVSLWVDLSDRKPEPLIEITFLMHRYKLRLEAAVF
ncbi:MAG: hypothetical protein H7126_11545 [Candidatus Parcubacteria bacterium]|uniref:hypothetical protein n=1 Tax=Phormidesmis priestleyi TaxID=268141 RepID=UPI0012E88183|nr:hypothetical protein [Phormidesmis priestleyi]MBC7824484.1 hypothetical protein [Leptolyngbyaceae cyanobacterium LF-bin-113]